MSEDKRPRNRRNELYETCKECGIEPQQCKGFCVVQKLEAEAEQEMNRRKKNGSRIQR